MVSHFDWQSSKQVRVLIACDDTALTERVWAFLEQGRETRPIATAISARECLEVIKNQAPDVLLLADDLPGEQSLDLCRAAINIHPRIAPILMAHPPHDRDPDLLHEALDTGVCSLIRVEEPYADLRYQVLLDSVMQAYHLMQERISGVGGGIGRVITFFSLKGGVGSSTLATNLGVMLARQEERRRVMLADFNWHFGSLDTLVGHVAHQSVLDLIPVLDGISRTDLESIAPPHSAGLRVLAAPLDSERTDFIRDMLAREVLEDERAGLLDEVLLQVREHGSVEVSGDSAAFMESLLKKTKVRQIVTLLARRTLQALRRSYHYVVVDTGPQIDDVTLTTLELADLIVLVCTPDVPSMRATRSALTLLSELGIAREHIGYVLNQTTRRSTIRVEDVQQLFEGYEMLGEIPADFRALQPYVNTGAVISENGVELPITRALHRFATQISERVPIAIVA